MTFVAECSTIARPHSADPCTTLKTPAGIPASSRTSAMRLPECGASSDGLNTTVFPHARAGKIFQLGTAIGKFHAVMIPQTPIGMRNERFILFGSSLGAL